MYIFFCWAMWHGFVAVEVVAFSTLKYQFAVVAEISQLLQWPAYYHSIINKGIALFTHDKYRSVVRDRQYSSHASLSVQPVYV